MNLTSIPSGLEVEKIINPPQNTINAGTIIESGSNCLALPRIMKATTPVIKALISMGFTDTRDC
jgi:hypothetical protein